MSDFVKPFVEAAVMLSVLILLTRLQGLRSFSKMSGFDFAVTVALGSVMASVVVLPAQGLGVGIAALCALFAVQAVVSRLRVYLPRTRLAFDNTPLLLMERGQVLQDNLLRAEISRGDLLAKLRAANVRRLDQVRAVVLETTGDISVLHGDDEHLDDAILEDVTRRR